MSQAVFIIPFEAGGGRGVAHKLSLPRIVCQRLFIFLLGWRRCGTRSSFQAICVPRIFHFILGMGEEWHTNSIFGGLCATVFSFFSVD